MHTDQLALVLLRSAGYVVPQFGTATMMSMIHDPTKMVVMLSSPRQLMCVVDAATTYPQDFCMLFVGDLRKPASIVRTVQVGGILFQMHYENREGWRADRGKVIHKWVTSFHARPDITNLDGYSVDMIGDYAVNLNTRVSLRQLGLNQLVSRSDLARGFKETLKQG